MTTTWPPLGSSVPYASATLRRELRSDIHADKPLDARVAEQRSHAGRLPDQRGVHRRLRLDALVREDLHVGADVCALADDRLVADHRADADHRAAPNVDVAAQYRARTLGLPADERVAPDDRVRQAHADSPMMQLSSMTTWSPMTAPARIVTFSPITTPLPSVAVSSIFAVSETHSPSRAWTPGMNVLVLPSRMSLMNLHVRLAAADVAPVAVHGDAVERVTVGHQLAETDRPRSRTTHRPECSRRPTAR